MEYRVPLGGWQAAVVGLLVLGIVTYQCVSRIQPVDDPARETLRVWLVKEYEGKGLRQELQAYLRRKAGGKAEPAQPATPKPSVGLVSLAAHGSKEIMVVRVQVKVNDGAPPATRAVRYMDLMRRDDGRWMVFAESDAFHYYWMLLMPVFNRRL